MTGPDERALLRLAATDPATAFVRALALLERGGGVLALRVAGLAAKELGRLDEGLGFLHRALELARGDGYRAAQVRMNLVGLLTARGELTEALAHARQAEAVLQGEDADRLAANKACALARAGRLDEAHELAVQTLPRLREGHDPAVLNGLLTNLGLARTFRGDLDAAESDLAEAVAVGEAAGLHHQTAMAKGNLAFVVSRRGDVPRALRLFAEAEPHLTGERLAQCRFDQAETLIMAGLPGEARPVLTAALDAATANGYGCDIADGYLLLAHAELADANPERCTDAAERARALFAGQERTGWMLLAEHVLLRARWACGERSAVLLRSAEATAARLEDGGWADAADEARIVAARVALSLGRPSGHLLSAVERSRGSVQAQIAGWHAVALERAARSDHAGAVEAVKAGLQVTEEHAEALGALDLRARAAGLAGELSDLGLGLADSAPELLAVEERRRMIARPARVRPPRDPERAAALTTLRVLSVEHTAGIAGSDPSAPPEGVAELEAEIRARTRRRPSGASPHDFPGIEEVAAALGGRALVEIIKIGPELHAVTIAEGEARRHHLGPSGDALRETGLIRFAVRRLAAEDAPEPLSALTDAARRLDNLVFAPLSRHIGDRELVIAPTGTLHGLPWTVLPSLTGRPFMVVPSVGAWLHAREPKPTDGHAVLVAGPDLDHAEREIAALQRLHPQAIVLEGPDARAEQVRDALDGAALVHIAAHGEFREGNPLFSRLRLADGPLVVHDLDEVAAPPRMIVLSACDIGRAAEGDAVLGMAGALLALGTATVVAAVTPVRDEATPAFMAAFHTAVATGRSPAQALADIPRPHGVTGFLCLGAG
ncbi:CHAT domain-containing protein [Actinomadura sp. 6K520]|uniref:CHAT domain-containing protein n=1 Tax=Actinomadura sp. 6K520 TaxID=2530364 RepID=UPI001FB6F892|nr:CHAT domain-containing protein [Actinomadura sp. 6K520]